MAAFNGVNATNIAANPMKLAEEGQQAGIRKTLYDKYVLTADLAASDVISMGGKLPQGAMIVAADLITEALGGSCTLDVGWDASDESTPLEAQNKTALFSAVAVSSAGLSTLASSGGTLSAIGYVLSSSVQLKIWEHAVSSGATGKYIKLIVSYLEC